MYTANSLEMKMKVKHINSLLAAMTLMFISHVSFADFYSGLTEQERLEMKERVSNMDSETRAAYQSANMTETGERQLSQKGRGKDGANGRKQQLRDGSGSGQQKGRGRH